MGGLLLAQAGKADPVTARVYLLFCNRLSNQAEHCCYDFLVIVQLIQRVAWPNFATQVKPYIYIPFNLATVILNYFLDSRSH